MVQAIVTISERANRVINIVKAKYGLIDKSEAINLLVKQYEEEIMEPELRPEFIKEIEEARKGKFIKVKNFGERYGLK
ncbi:MAG: DUF2683 family protein [Candidatus Woesearchaeota archaeon]|nr:MAG: DUF2683 family protein [Candidatus Woesearchaeota archaeon]